MESTYNTIWHLFVIRWRYGLKIITKCSSVVGYHIVNLNNFFSSLTSKFEVDKASTNRSNYYSTYTISWKIFEIFVYDSNRDFDFRCFYWLFYYYSEVLDGLIWPPYIRILSKGCLKYIYMSKAGHQLVKKVKVKL